MRIKTFSPEIMAGVPPEKNLEEKMVHSDVLTSTDVKDYADYIISHLKILKNSSEQEKELFVVEALRDNKILSKVSDEVRSGDLDRNEAKAAIRRVRQALVEELKGKMDDDLYLKIRTIVPKPFEVTEIKNKYGIHKIYKDQTKHNDRDDKNYRDAFNYFNSLKPHPNIVKVEAHDPETRQSILEKLDMITLWDYLEFNTPKKEHLIIALQAVNDCMAGASYLADNGLVLFDIHPVNIALEMIEDRTKGILFDLEGLIQTEKTVSSQPLAHAQYVPPERNEWNGGPPANPAEMVFQFGLCLDMVYDWIIKRSGKPDDALVGSLMVLCKKMRATNPLDRPSLVEAKDELENIISKFKHY